MKVIYKTATGNVEIDVNEDWGNIVNDFNQKDANAERRYRYHNYSLDAGEEMGMQYECESNIDDLFQEPSMEEKLHVAISKLKPAQKELIKAIYFDGIPAKEYAEQLGVSKSAISHRLEVARKNLKKFL